MIILDIDTGSTNEIIAFEGDNTKELTTIALVKDNNRIDLTNKIIDMGYSDVNSQSVGDVIENLTISNAKQGEISLPINSNLTKKDGFYNCAFKITGEGGYKKFTAPFRLWIKANLFTNISKAIINTDTFNSIKEILSNADKLKQDLSNAETTLSNINNANIEAKENIKSLTDNNAKADSSNKTLVNSNNLAKENIANLDTANNKATENISTLDSKNKAARQTVKDLATQNNTAENNINTLQSNIDNAKNINIDLENKSNKAAELNKELTANVSSVDSKNNMLKDSLKQAEDFSKTLKNGTDFVQMRKDIDTLENGLKNNQMLAYSGSDITCNNSLEGRTSGLKLYGNTLQNIADSVSIQATGGVMQEDIITIDNSVVVDGGIMVEVPIIKPNTRYTIIYIILENRNYQGMFQFDAYTVYPTADRINLPVTKGLNKVAFNTKNTIEKTTIKIATTKTIPSEGSILKMSKNIIILEGDWTNKDIPTFFEGIKSTGEAEGNKISYLSYGRNRCTNKTLNAFINANQIIQSDLTTISYIAKIFEKGTYYLTKTKGDRSMLGYFKEYPKIGDKAEIVGSGSITVPSEGYIVAYVLADKNINNINNVNNVMISKNINDTFEPYKEDLKEILLPQGCSFNGFNGIQDTIEETSKGVIYTQRIGKIILNGTEDWNLGVKSGGWKEFDDTLVFYMGSYIKPKYGTEILSDKFQSVHDTSINNVIGISNQGWSSEGHFSIRLKRSELETPDTQGFINYLKAKPITAYYVLAEPKAYLLKGIEETDIDTYNIITYVKSLNTIPATIDFSIATNYGSLLNQHSQEINRIWDTINKLLVPALIDVNKNVAMTTIKNNL